MFYPRTFFWHHACDVANLKMQGEPRHLQWPNLASYFSSSTNQVPEPRPKYKLSAPSTTHNYAICPPTAKLLCPGSQPTKNTVKRIVPTTSPFYSPAGHVVNQKKFSTQSWTFQKRRNRNSKSHTVEGDKLNEGGADDQRWSLMGDYYYVQASWPYNSHRGSQHQRLRALLLELRMCSQCQELGLELELAVCDGCPVCLPIHCKFIALLLLQTNWTNLTIAVSCKKEHKKVLETFSEYMHLQVFPLHTIQSAKPYTQALWEQS